MGLIPQEAMPFVKIVACYLIVGQIEKQFENKHREDLALITNVSGKALVAAMSVKTVIDMFKAVKTIFYL